VSILSDFAKAASSAADATPAGAIAKTVAAGVATVLDHVLPEDPATRDAAALKVMELQSQGTFDQRADLALKTGQLEMGKAEASSSDGYTSRARPSFLYVMYTLLLMGIPMGVLSAFNPHAAQAIAEGFKAWLTAIPDSLYGLMGVGIVGYTVSRSAEKIKGAA